jgi:hypothetical protein
VDAFLELLFLIELVDASDGSIIKPIDVIYGYNTTFVQNYFAFWVLLKLNFINFDWMFEKNIYIYNI